MRCDCCDFTAPTKNSRLANLILLAVIFFPPLASCDTAVGVVVVQRIHGHECVSEKRIWNIIKKEKQTRTQLNAIECGQ